MKEEIIKVRLSDYELAEKLVEVMSGHPIPVVFGTVAKLCADQLAAQAAMGGDEALCRLCAMVLTMLRGKSTDEILAQVRRDLETYRSGEKPDAN